MSAKERSMNAQQQSFLERFGERVSFDPTERRLYGHDIAAIPSLVAPLIGNTTPDAVVQPESEQELVELVRWAAAERVPLTPRGKASSGYGGAIPVKRGVVVDFYRMRRMLCVDPQGMTVTVQSGITWEQLDHLLKEHDLTLRLYPTSYPSSTVGGWLAQGGAGIGSFQFGYFRENVVSARVVLPSGEVRELRGTDLDLVSDTEGITGLISQVTLRVQPLADLRLAALSIADPHTFQALLQALIDARLPIWSMIFISPKMAELRNQAPLREHNGHPAEHHVELPHAYIVTLAFRAADAAAIYAALPPLAARCGAQVLSDAIAQHEWAQRFKLMTIKRLGPSLVPAEVIVPLAGLADTLDEFTQKVGQPLVKEGVVLRQGANGVPEVVILGFIPADQRKFSYNFVFGLALT